MLASVHRVADRAKVVIGRVAVAVDLKAAGLGGQPYGLPDVNASAETAAGVTSISISFVAKHLGRHKSESAQPALRVPDREASG
jgi:hypothetical protein